MNTIVVFDSTRPYCNEYGFFKEQTLIMMSLKIKMKPEKCVFSSRTLTGFSVSGKTCNQVNL